MTNPFDPLLDHLLIQKWINVDQITYCFTASYKLDGSKWIILNRH